MPVQEETQSRKSALRSGPGGMLPNVSAAGASPPLGPPPGKTARVEEEGAGVDVDQQEGDAEGGEGDEALLEAVTDVNVEAGVELVAVSELVEQTEGKDPTGVEADG